MNENVVKLIEQLANKLGTTSEYLWSVLIKQAPISASITLIQMAILLLLSFFLFKTHIRLMKKTSDDRYAETKYDQLGDWSGFAMAIVGGVVFILLILCCGSLEDVVNGFFNPEYWALKEILRAI